MKAWVNGPVYCYDPAAGTYRASDALVIEGRRIVSIDAADIGAGIEIVDLDGRAIYPAFADCHVHLTDTGYYLDERNLSAARSYDDFAARVQRLVPERYVLAGNYDESGWVDGRLADAVPLGGPLEESYAMLVRVDSHSCIVNAKTLAFLDLDPTLAGIERDPDGTPTGKLFTDANWQAQARFFALLPDATKRAAERRAVALAQSQGAVHLHVQLVGFGSRAAYRAEVDALRAFAGVQMYPKICERDPQLALDLGLPYVGGDVFLDGSIGSGTAAMTHAYADRAGAGTLAHDDATVERYFAEAERLGISAGVHAIGDRAIEQCLSSWERVLGDKPSPRNRHFIEHFEVARPDQIARAVKLGIYLSMQPQFDARWGGEGGMYDVRLGTERMRSMNAFASAKRAGATIVGGDDSPVCSLVPLAGMQAAVAHQTPSERIAIEDALTMYTYDAARFGHIEDQTGRLASGFNADFVIVRGDPIADRNFEKTRIVETWSQGERVYAA